MEYVVILGKNPELSTAELRSFLSARTSYTIIQETNAYVLVDVKQPQNWSLLGGSLKVGEVLATGNPHETYSTLDYSSFAPRPRSLFSLETFVPGREQLGNGIKKELKKLGLTVGFSKKPLTHTQLIKKHVLDTSFELIALPTRLARTCYVHNPFAFKERDIGRPAQRPIYAIPPRLCRIMINLAQATKGHSFYDPFCGTGTILQEAALMGLRILGSDKRKKALTWVNQNMTWLESKFHRAFPRTLFTADARYIQHAYEKPVDCIVTEPDLGPPLRRRPTRHEADKIFSTLLGLYEGFLSTAYALIKPGGRLVFVAPAFFFSSGIYSMHLRPFIEQLGFVWEQDHYDYDRGDKTIRHIIVCYKPLKNQKVNNILY